MLRYVTKMIRQNGLHKGSIQLFPGYVMEIGKKMQASMQNINKPSGGTSCIARRDTRLIFAGTNSSPSDSDRTHVAMYFL